MLFPLFCNSHCSISSVQGAPCHLYFDLEYSKRINTGKNGDVMVDSLISVILEALNEKYSIQGSFDWILELDSSNEGIFAAVGSRLYQFILTHLLGLNVS